MYSLHFTSFAIHDENLTLKVFTHHLDWRISLIGLYHHSIFEDTSRRYLDEIEQIAENLYGNRTSSNDRMIIKSLILGIIQGLTEFLPISSSGHLAILEAYFDISEPVVFATFLHFGTFIATVVFFRNPILHIGKGIVKGEKESINYVINILVGTIPIILFVLLLRNQIEQSFKDIRLVGLLLGITGVVLLLTNAVKKNNRKVTFFTAILIGISQMFATFPGISRSGFTISTGLFAKVSPKDSFNFSFLLSLPAVLGANLLEFCTLPHIANYPSLLIGMLCSLISGLIALKILRKLVHKKFHLFGIYCLALSIALLLIK